MTPPPTHSHSTIGFTATPIVTRPCSLGDEISVRYTSSRSPVRTDGVPMPCGAFGNVEIAGVYVPRSSPPRSMRTSADTVFFWPLRSRASRGT